MSKAEAQMETGEITEDDPPDHITFEMESTMAEAGSSRSDSSGPLVLFTHLKPTQKKSQKMGKWMITFIEVVVFVLFLGGLIATLTDHLVKKNHVIWVYPPWKWCVLVLVIVSSRRITGLITGWMMGVVVFLIKKTLPSHLVDKILSMKYNVNYSYFIYSLRKSIRAVLWFGSVLLTWFILFKNGGVKASKVDSLVLKYVRRTIATSVIGGFLWVLKTLLVNALSSPFQKATRLFDRFRGSLIDQYILHVFSANDNGAKARENVGNWINDNHLPRYDCIKANGAKARKDVEKWINNWLPPYDCTVVNGAEEEKVINWLKKIEPEKLSAWTMEKLIEMIRATQLSSITEELENLAKKELDMDILFAKTDDVASKNFIFKKTDGDVVADQILVRRMNGSGEIEEFTLETFFNDEAGDVVQHINGGEKVAGTEGLTLGTQALRKWLVDAIVERRSLAQSLENTERTIKELNKLISMTVFIMIFFLWLIMLGILTTEVLVVILTQFAALAFIFGDTGKSVFQGIVFVFVMHPIDIGDCCRIDGEEMMVERINLLSTVFRKNMKDKIVYPNSALIGMRIKNLDKGNRHLIRDSLEITIDSSTPQDRIDDLKDKITRYLNDKKNKDNWLQKDIVFNLKGIEDRKLKIVLGVYYRKTDRLSDREIVSSRRDLIVKQLKMLLQNENGQKNEEEKGKNKDDGQQNEEEKGMNKDRGQIKEKEIEYYNILPEVVDAE